jgi:hypothetical protein
MLSARWRLKTLKQHCTHLINYSLSGIWRLLRALGIHYKKGQQHIHSPDAEYGAKKERIETCVETARAEPEVVTTLFLDEFSFYRWPTTAPVYAPAGREQPKADLLPGYNTRSRIVCAVDVGTGRVLHRQRAKITVRVLVDFLEDIRQAFPAAQQIHVIQDNWHNVHFHPDQVEAAARLGIDLVPLPVYAPWLNPCEKVGRKMRQDVIHMHRQAGDWPQLKECVDAFFAHFAYGSSELLRYLGLLPA